MNSKDRDKAFGDESNCVRRFDAGSALRTVKLLALLVIIFFGANFRAGAAKASDPSGADDFFDLDDLGYSAVPIVGFDDKSGWLFGGAGFIYSDVEPGINAGLFGVTNMNDFHSATLNYEQRRGEWLLAFHGLAERAFDNYYGEGDLTRPDNPFRISMHHFEAKPSLLYRFFPRFRAGFFVEHRSRLETGIERLGDPVVGDPTRLFPDESSNAIGIRTEWDTRDKIVNTRKGDFYQLSLAYGPHEWTTLSDQANVVQVQVDLRRYRNIYRRVTFASRFLAALSSGQPSYLYRYRMGGLDALRGYKENRFRGTNFFLFQEELRWFLKKWLSINLSSDLGGIGDPAFNQLKMTVQAGIRLGLPPDWGQKMRIDLGYGFDQQTFQIQFGEIF